MKRLLLFFISAFAVLSFNSCSNDDLTVNDAITFKNGINYKSAFIKK